MPNLDDYLSAKPESYIRGVLFSPPLFPLGMFFFGPTLGLVALAFLASLVINRKVKIIAGLLPGCVLLGGTIFQIMVGFLCQEFVTLLALGATLVIVIFSIRRPGLHPLVGLLPVTVGIGLGLMEWPFFIAGPVSGVILFLLWTRQWFKGAGRWLPLLSLLSLTMMIVDITWYAGTEVNRADIYAKQKGVQRVFGFEEGKQLGEFVANRARFLVPLPDGSLALGIRGGQHAILRLTGNQVAPLGAGRFASDNAVVLPDGLITSDIRTAKLYRIGGQPLRVITEASTGQDRVGILRLSGDWLYTISENRSAVQAFNATTFARGYEYPVGLQLSDLDTRSNYLYLTTFVGGKVFCIDPTTGKKEWQATTASLLQQNLTVTDEAAYVISFLPGYIYKLGRQYGDYIAVKQIRPGCRYCAFHEPTQTLAVSDYLGGKILFYDAQTLELRVSVPVGRRPRWIESDGKGNLLVVSAAGGFRLNPQEFLPAVQ